MRNSAQNRRDRCGQLVVELVVACLLFLPISILGFCTIVCEIATSINDRACRDAARAAADASDFATALKKAQAVMVSHSTSGPLYGPAKLDVSKFVFEDYIGTPPPNALPYVSVTTVMPCVIPAPIRLFSEQIGDKQTVNFTRTYRFPIIKLKLYLPNGE